MALALGCLFEKWPWPWGAVAGFGGLGGLEGLEGVWRVWRVLEHTAALKANRKPLLWPWPRAKALGCLFEKPYLCKPIESYAAALALGCLLGKWPWPWGACWGRCLEGLDVLEGLDGFGGFGRFWRVWGVWRVLEGV